MATWLRVRLPSGEHKKVFYHKGQYKKSIVNKVLLPPWYRYCLRNWCAVDATGSLSNEERVKNFLDDCGYLLLRDNPEDTMTAYKEMARGRSEIPVSSCPSRIKRLYGFDERCSEEKSVTESEFEVAMATVDDKAKEVGVKPKVAKEPYVPSLRKQRINQIRQDHPGSVFHFCRIDTENCFTFHDTVYRVSESIAAYLPTQTKHGLHYDMDEVVVAAHEDGLSFYDATFVPIPDDAVTKQ